MDMDGLWPMLRSGMNRLHFFCRDMTKEGRIRFFDEFLPTLHDVKHQTLQEHDHDSWYLVYIGTKPGSRKRGYAKRLIEDVTRKVSLASRLPSSPLNLPSFPTSQAKRRLTIITGTRRMKRINIATSKARTWPTQRSTTSSALLTSHTSISSEVRRMLCST